MIQGFSYLLCLYTKMFGLAAVGCCWLHELIWVDVHFVGLRQ